MKEHRKPIIFAGHILHLTDAEVRGIVDKFLNIEFNTKMNFNQQPTQQPTQQSIIQRGRQNSISPYRNQYWGTARNSKE